jgi:hypothetical protein
VEEVAGQPGMPLPLNAKPGGAADLTPLHRLDDGVRCRDPRALHAMKRSHLLQEQVRS